MIKKLKIGVAMCLATCFFNFITPCLITPVCASNKESLLTTMSHDLSDLTVVNDFQDLHEDISDVTSPIHTWPLGRYTTQISTAMNKLWAGTLWIKTWMWTQIR